MSNPLDPTAIPKFVNELVIPPVYRPTIVKRPITDKVISHDYEVTVSQFTQQILPAGFPETTVWGYGGEVIIPETGPFRPLFLPYQSNETTFNVRQSRYSLFLEL